ncbi:MAG: hypothetical protein ACI8YQ_004276 [Polaribacter sp.]
MYSAAITNDLTIPYPRNEILNISKNQNQRHHERI